MHACSLVAAVAILAWSIAVSLCAIVLGVAFPAAARRQSVEPSVYVKVEVKGKLVKKDYMHWIESGDAIFADTQVMVALARSEDKNRELDRHLQSLEGKTVIASGYLDCRHMRQPHPELWLHLSNVAQVKAAGN